MDYKSAGVNVEEGYAAVAMMKEHVHSTFDKNVLGDVGLFGGFYSIKDFMGMQEPVLVAGTDGVGTKLKIAFAMNKVDTVGIDCVAMCVNDVVCQGAKPLFFLDYLATGMLEAPVAAQIVAGIAQGCRDAGCALIGGETAEMPGFYPDKEFDLAGFSVGIVDRMKAINGSKVCAGDVLVGLASSGVHSNGFSLVRKIFGDTPEDLNVHMDELGGLLGDELLKPTRIYVKNILALIENFELHGVAHITGGGFIENIPRILPEGLQAEVVRGSWPVPAIFDLMTKRGGVSEHGMYNTFNMGIGMVLSVPANDVHSIIAASQANGYAAYEIGRIAAGDAGVVLCER